MPAQPGPEPELPAAASVPGSPERFASMLLHALKDPALARAIHAAVRRAENELAKASPAGHRN
jgi:hypothetical protein